MMKFVSCVKHEFDGVKCSELNDMSSLISHGLNCYIEDVCNCFKKAPIQISYILEYFYKLGPYMYPMEIEFSILVG